MPTCSQAKIITNLETDIQKRLFALTRTGGGGGGGGGCDGITQYQQAGGSSGENSVNDENFYDAVQNLNNHHQHQYQQQHQQQQEQQSHQPHISDSNAYSEISKLNTLTSNLNVNENFKIYQSFHRPTKILSNNSALNQIGSLSAYNSGNAGGIMANSNSNSNIAYAAINVNNANVRRLGTLKIGKQQSVPLMNDPSKSINNNQPQQQYIPTNTGKLVP